MARVTWLAKVTRQWSKMMSTLLHEAAGSDNMDPLIRDCLVADELLKLAKKNREQAWKAAAEVLPSIELEEGEHRVKETEHFLVKCNVSAPVKRFNAKALAEEMHKRFKVSVHTAGDMIEAAKLPTKSMQTWKVEERG